jgi:hypothetical protein
VAFEFGSQVAKVSRPMETNPLHFIWNGDEPISVFRKGKID